MISSADQRQTVQARIKEKAAEFGNKSANLIELDNLCQSFKSDVIRVQIPPIIAISDATIKKHLDKNAKLWNSEWLRFVEEQKNNKKLTAKSKEIIQNLQSYIKLCFQKYPLSINEIKSLKLPKDTLFMIRSTGDEDTIDMANPGGNKSVAAVKYDQRAISNAIGTVIASYISKKSLKQRLLSGDDITKPPFIPVLLQTMVGEKLNGEINPVNIIVSGVMYAKDAMTRIEAAPGHGELIVNSKAPFDIFDVTKNHVVHAEIHQKPGRLIPVEIKKDKETKRKLLFVDNPKILQNKPALEPEIAREIAGIGQKIQSHYGIPTDIEFVYDPNNKILSIVQARPIPEPKFKITPSAISPEVLHQFETDSSIDIIKARVITPAGRAAKVITNKNQIIIAPTLGDALKKYLADDKNQENIRAIFVKEDAPSTSHEAAIFNALSIPVMQGDVESIHEWFKDHHPAIILDTQHRCAVNVRKILKNPEFSENEIKENKIIVEGLFSSILSSKKTLISHQAKFSYPILKTIKAYLKESPNAMPEKFIYQKLLADLQLLETSKPNHENKVAFDSLKQIADIFRRLGTSTNAKKVNNPHKALFTHAMITIADIHLCLESYAKIGENHADKMSKRQELLDLISKLKALILNTSEKGLFSDAIMQIAMQNKAKLRYPQSWTNADIATELLKLGELAFNAETKKSWEQFATSCCYSTPDAYKLAKIVYFFFKNNLQSDFINHYYLRMKKEDFNYKTLANVWNEINKTKEILANMQFQQNQFIIESFERRLLEWANPKKFDSLYKAWEKELVPIINKLRIEDQMPQIAKSVILSQVQKLTDCMDKTIKSLKGSPEYSKEGKSLLVERFISLLKPYHSLMRIWMGLVPNYLFEKWRSKIDEAYYNSQLKMLEIIEQVFNEKIRDKSERNLEPSQKFSVASCRLGSTASFNRQFVELSKHLTLEDLFTLFHQNIISATNILEKRNALKNLEDFPAPIQLLLKGISSTHNAELLCIHHDQPILKFDFNIPVQNHSIQICLEYNENTKNIKLHWNFFGRNWASRMNIIALKASLECYLVDGKLTDIATYNEESRSLEFTWHFKGDKINLLIQHIKTITESYVTMTDNIPSYGRIFEDLYKKYVKNSKYEVSKNMQKDILYKMAMQLNKLPLSDLIRMVDTPFHDLLLKEDLAKLIVNLPIDKLIKSLTYFKSILPKDTFENILKYKDDNDDNVLICAAYQNAADTIRYLLELDVIDIHHKNKAGLTYQDILEYNRALDFAEKKHFEKVFEILKNNINISLTKPIKRSRSLLIKMGEHLIECVKNETLAQLKDFIVKIPAEFLPDILHYSNFQNQRSAVMIAALYGKYDHVKYLTEIDNTPSAAQITDLVNKNIEYLITKNSYLDIFSILNKCKVTLSQSNICLIQEKFIQYAKEANLYKMKELEKALPANIFQEILLTKDNNGDTALSWAAYYAYPAIYFKLIYDDEAKKYLEIKDWLLSVDTSGKLAQMKNNSQKDYLATHSDLLLSHLARQKQYKTLNDIYTQCNGQIESKVQEESFIQILKSNFDIGMPKGELHAYIKNFSLELFQYLFTSNDLFNILSAVSTNEVILFLEEIHQYYPKLNLTTDQKNLSFIQNIEKQLLEHLIDKNCFNDALKILHKLKDVSLYSLLIIDHTSFRDFIFEKLSALINNNNNYLFMELRQLLASDIFETICVQSNNRNSLSSVAAIYGNYEALNVLLSLDNHLKLKDLCDNLGLNLTKLAVKYKYSEIANLINKYKQTPLGDLLQVEIRKNLFMSTIGNQLMQSLSTNGNQFEQIKSIFPIDQFQEIYKYVDPHGETLLTTAAFRGNLKIFDWLSEKIQDKSFCQLRNRQQFDAFANLGYYLTVALNNNEFAKVAEITAKYKAIPYNLSYSDTQNFSFMSILRGKFAMLLKENDLVKASLLKNAIPDFILDEVFLRDTNESGRTLISELWGSKISTLAHTWLQENVSLPLDFTMKSVSALFSSQDSKSFSTTKPNLAASNNSSTFLK